MPRLFTECRCRSWFWYEMFFFLLFVVWWLGWSALNAPVPGQEPPPAPPPVTAAEAPATSSSGTFTVSLPPLSPEAFARLYWPFTSDSPPRAAFVVGGDYRGRLTPCGCPRIRLGGFPWRMDFISRLQSHVPVYQLDTGGTLTSGRAAGISPGGQISDAALLEADYNLSVLKQAGVTALNITLPEAILLNRLWNMPVSALPTGSPASSPIVAWQPWLPHTFPLLSPDDPRLAQHGPPSPVTSSGKTAGLQLLSANLRHPRLKTFSLLTTPEGDYVITGLSTVSMPDFPSLPFPWRTLSPLKGWQELVRQDLSRLARQHSLRGIIVLFAGASSEIRELAPRMMTDVARLHSSPPLLVFYSVPPQLKTSELKTSPSEPAPATGVPVPVGDEGQFLAVAYPFRGSFHLTGAVVTSQFRALPQTRTFWDALMESSLELQNYGFRLTFNRSPAATSPR